MKPNRVLALVIGCLLLLPGVALLVGGVAVGSAYAFGREDDGYFETSVEGIETTTVAVTTEGMRFAADPGSPGWVEDLFEADVRLRVTSRASDPVFVGIGPERAVDRYLAGVAHEEVDRLDGDEAVLVELGGRREIAPPGEQAFWVASVAGVGTQELDWEATDGRWAAVVMNADGSRGVAADVDVGVRVDGLLAIGLVLGAVGVLLTLGAVGLIVFAAVSSNDTRTGGPIPAPAPPAARPSMHQPAPVALRASLDPGLSRWHWMVKWFLAIPHFVVLAFLWVAFVVLTVVAGWSILLTGRYPRRLFDFNVGVLRWTWRVSFYATTGGIGTDAYPPFSLHAEPGDAASLDIVYPERLSRTLVLVKWWLLAIPHYMVVALLVGGAWPSERSAPGLLGVLVLVAGAHLLFRDRYPRPLFDLIVGLNRWVYRVIAYAALMTDEYPPFRLDQGGDEPPPLPPAPSSPAGAALDRQDTDDRPPSGVAR